MQTGRRPAAVNSMICSRQANGLISNWATHKGRTQPRLTARSGRQPCWQWWLPLRPRTCRAPCQRWHLPSWSAQTTASSGSGGSGRHVGPSVQVQRDGPWHPPMPPPCPGVPWRPPMPPPALAHQRNGWQREHFERCVDCYIRYVSERAPLVHQHDEVVDEVAAAGEWTGACPGWHVPHCRERQQLPRMCDLTAHTQKSTADTGLT